MVCDKCEKKMTKVIVQDTWKDGARNTIGGKDGGKSIGGTSSIKRLRTTSARFTPTRVAKKCRICLNSLPSQKHYYCQPCSYKKGICAMCGKKIVDTTSFKMSSR